MFSRFARRVLPRAAAATGVIATISVFTFSQDMTSSSSLEDAIVEKTARENSAFLFIKPHAANDSVAALVRSALQAAGITVHEEGDISAEEIDEKLLIDTHYGAIASKAVILKPNQLNVPAKGKAGFEKMFGLTWDDAVAQGLVYNAKDGAEHLGVDGFGLENKWRGLTRGKDLIKFGGGFYCGKVDGVFVMNGFYMSMRAAYTTPGEKIHFMTVSWPIDTLSWEDFRGKVLGATNPAEAEEYSVRRLIMDNYKELGLHSKPDTGNNGVHASASPLEAMAERKNWLRDLAYTHCVPALGYVDNFELALKSRGIESATIEEWSGDSQVSYQGGSKGSVFDLVEDKNADTILNMVNDIN